MLATASIVLATLVGADPAVVVAARGQPEVTAVPAPGPAPEVPAASPEAPAETGPETPPEPAPDPAPAPAPAPTPALAPSPAPPVSAPPPPGTAAAATAPATPDRRSGEHLRPPREAELLGPHEIDLEHAQYVPGDGLTFTSKDGRFELATRLRAQLLYSLAHDGEDRSTLHGLQIRRARLQFKGHAFNEHNQFKVELALSPRDMALDGVPTRTPILDWYFDFTYLRDLSFRIGQYKIPYSRQRVVSSGDLQLVDRSTANGEFNLDRDIGFDIRSKDFLGVDRLRYYAGVYLGEGRDQFELSTFELMYLGRIEVLPFGLFDDYEEADFERSLRPRLSLGGAYAFIDGAVNNRGVLGSTPTDAGTTDYHNVTADAVFKIGGFSLFTDVYYRHGRREFGEATVVDDMGVETPAPREPARNGLGWSAQAGFLVPRVPFEIAARYGEVLPLHAGSALTRRDEAGGGLSYYFAGHPLKLQLDYFALWADGRIEQTDSVVRLQLQASL